MHMHDRAANLSPAAIRLLEKAAAALDRKQCDVAETALIGVLALAPACVEAQRLLGLVQQQRGDYIQAVTILKQALALSPDDALVHMNLGTSLYGHGKIAEAIASLQRACELSPTLAATWFNLGKMLSMQACPDKAYDALRRTLELDPSHLAARILLAETQVIVGEIDNAASNYREVLRRQPDYLKAWIGLSNLKTMRFSKNDVTRLKQVLQRAPARSEARISLGFALAKALEDQADYPAAFEAFREANALKHRQVRWDAVAASAQVDAILAAFPRPAAGTLDSKLGEQVIFIVSLPRSGSTLTEQILASHPQVEGANELNDLQEVIDDESARRGQPFPQWVRSTTTEDWSRLGRDYLVRTERWRKQRPRFTDKSLLNWRLVGAAMAMLPGARVVNSRRDAVENCFGCYRQLFVNGNHFSYDLDDMASYWIDYDRLSRHWQRLFPEHFFDHVYETLLADPHAQVRQLLEFCGLKYDPACLEFHRTKRVVRTASAAQVRQPLRQDTARSPFYGSKLNRLRGALKVSFHEVHK